MFGLSKAAMTYVISAIAALIGVGTIAYQSWKSQTPPAPAPTPAIATAPAAPVAATPSPPTATQPAAAPAPAQQIAAVPPPAAPATTAPATAPAAPPPSATVAPTTPQQSAAVQTPAPAPAAPQAAARGEPLPEFDVVRVEPTGGAVVAGRAAPNSKVVLLNKGQEIASVQSDANGQFVIVPLELPPGDHILALGNERSGARVDSTQNVTVSVPQRGGGNTLVALAEPDKPTRILSDPSRPAATSGQQVAAAPPPSAGVSAPTPAIDPSSVTFRTVEADESGGFFATGTGTAGATIRLYLNDISVATVTSGADRQWSLRIERGMAPGAYRVRADLVDASGNVLARAEVPFDYPDRRVAAAPAVPVPPSRPADLPGASPATPATPATAELPAVAAAPQPAASPAPAAPVSAPAAPAVSTANTEPAKAPEPAPNASANAVVPEIQTVTVVRGDNLWRISRKMLGRGMRYTQIYEANTAQIRDPRLIYPNQILVVPGAQQAN
jgi:hypothetical protein